MIIAPHISNAPRRLARWAAFTLLELVLVVAIIGFMAAMALPHLGGFTKANTMTAATRQLLDDCALARQRALVNRSDVYMVFLPTNFWFGMVSNQQIMTMVPHQLAAYALISMRTVGDQPGQSFPHYLTSWRTLPSGIFIAPFQFADAVLNQQISIPIYTTNTTMPGPYNYTAFTVWPWNQVTVPFPSTFNNSTNLTLPGIGFNASGQIISTNNSADQFIVLTRGSVFYPSGPNGAPQLGAADVVETPPGTATNNPTLIHLDALTGRARVEHNTF